MGRLIDTDRLKEVFSRNVVGGNAYFDLIDNAPTVEAIPKAEYETRLKEDMMIILDFMFDKMKAEVEQTRKMYLDMNDIDWLNGCDYVLSVIDKYKAKIQKENEEEK